MVRKIKLSFAKSLEIQFTDREKALKQIEEIGEKGTRFPLVIFGPEGCGKTALLKQSSLLLEEMGYEVIYVNPNEYDIGKAIYSSQNIRELVSETLKELTAIYLGNLGKELANLCFSAVSKIVKKFRKPKIAILIDDVFQAIGLEKETIASYVKSALNLIEYPPAEYDSIVTIIVTSEGVSRKEIGRHRWADVIAMWNITKKGFREIYEKIPASKPSFEDVWEICGGNPWVISKFYELNWKKEELIETIAKTKNLYRFVIQLSNEEKEALIKAIDDIEYLWKNLRNFSSLVDKLIELNLLIEIYDRDPIGWIDEAPPERDLEIGIGRYLAWQTPLHREAVRKVLKKTKLLI